MEQQNRTLSGFEVRSRRGKKPRTKVRNRKKGIPHEVRTEKGNSDSGRRRQGLGVEGGREARESTDGRRNGRGRGFVIKKSFQRLESLETVKLEKSNEGAREAHN